MWWVVGWLGSRGGALAGEWGGVVIGVRCGQLVSI